MHHYSHQWTATPYYGQQIQSNPHFIGPFVYPPPFWFYPPYWGLPPVPPLWPPPFPIIL